MRSRDTIDVLNNELVCRLQTRELYRMWMAPPAIIDWADAKAIRFLRKRSRLFPDLDIGDFTSVAVDLKWLDPKKCAREASGLWISGITKEGARYRARSRMTRLDDAIFRATQTLSKSPEQLMVSAP